MQIYYVLAFHLFTSKIISVRLSKIFIPIVILLAFIATRASAGMTDYKLPPSDTSFSINIVGNTSFCPGGNVSFEVKSNLAFPAGISYQWKNPASISGATNATYIANAAGTYSVVVTRGAGRDTILSAAVVTLFSIPTANYTFSQNNLCSGVPVFFADNSGGSIVQYSWNFGDGQSSNLKNPYHPYSAGFGDGAQTFSVVLKVTDNNGCISNGNSTNITIKQKPEANIVTDSTVNCSGAISSSFIFTNGSSTNLTNSNYSFIWGDGSTLDLLSFTNQSHTYNFGNHTLLHIVTGQNGCKDSTSEDIYVGSNPHGGIVSPGSTDRLCVGNSLIFPLTFVNGNSPGTNYNITFGDNTQAQTYTQNDVPSSVTHTFNTSSCGVPMSYGFNNSFVAIIQATNPCGVTSSSVTPIYVSQNPNASFTISKDTNCVNTNTTFTNTTPVFSVVSNFGVCTTGSKQWQITPNSGYTITSGSLTADILNLSFGTPGTYTIKLTVTGNGSCPPSTIEKTVCINAVPIAAFSLENTTGCLPLNIIANNSSSSPNCGNNSYNWTSSYTPTSGCLPNTSSVSFTNGTNSSSLNPQFQFSNPGTYSVNLQVTSPAAVCVSPIVSQQVIVKSKPTVSGISVAASVCVGNPLSPTVTVGNCNSSSPATYAWSFPGADITSSTNAIPVSIHYPTAGSKNLNLGVTNECGTINVSTNVTINSFPTAPTGIDNARCGSGTVALSATAAVGEMIDWYSSATGGTLLKSSSNSYTTTSLSSTTIYYAESKNASGCVSLTRTPVTATINPIPVAPTIGSNSSICSGSTLNLTSTLISGVTYLWSGPNGFSSTSQNPSISNATILNSGIYSLVVNLNTCSSATVNTTATVNPIPSSPTANSNTPVCVGNTLNLSATTISGATYAWSGPNGFISSSQNPSITNVNLINDGIYSVIATVNGCGNVSSNTTVIINSLPTVSITNPATVCTLVPVDLTTASITNGSSSGLIYSYWNNLLATSVLSNQTSVLTAGTYYIKGLNSNNCSDVKPVLVSFNPLPTSYSVTGGGTYCSGGSGVSIGLSSSEIGINYLLMLGNNAVGTSIAGTGIAINFGSQTTAGTYTVIATNSTTNCVKTMTGSVLVSITSLTTPSITINPSANPICNGTSVTFTATTVNSGATPSYKWQLNGIIVGLNSTIYSNASLVEGDIITCTLTTSGCSTDASVVSNALIMIVNARPAITNVTPGSICGTGTVTLSASSSGGIINWYSSATGGVSLGTGNPFITPILNNTTNYYVDAINNNCVTNSRTLISASVNPLPQATVIAAKTICLGSNVQIGASAKIGNTYSWTSVPASTISNISNPTVAPIVNTIYTLQETVTNTGCSKSNSVTININPIPNVTANPSIETICSNTFSNIVLSTTVPNTTFNWTITNNSNISGAIAGTGNSIAQKLINTSALPQNITYKILPSYTNNGITCIGSESDVLVTVNPSPTVNFSKSNETICTNNATSVVILSSSTTDAQISWTASQPSGISGVIISGTDNIPIQTLVNSTGLPITVNYIANGKTNDVNACEGVNATYSIIVNPVPTVVATPSSQMVCSNNSISIVLSTTVSGTSFDWTISINSNITGASNGTGNSITQTLINTSATIQNIQYTITPKIINNGITCYGTPINVPIIINPSPSLVGPLTQTSICTNNLFTYNQTSNTTNTVFTWTRPAIAGISNPAVGNGTNGISEILINSTQSPIKVSYNYTLTANGCSNNQVVVDTIFPNAKSVFVVDKLISCAPYKLSDHITVSRFPLANDELQYIWLANNIQIATGLQVPTYIISGASDTVKLALIAKSKYGCTSDTMIQTIYTIEQPVPGFTISSHKACGPVSISFQNTTNPINVLNNSSYFWDLGNGNTSTSINPVSQIYNSAPSLKDTTYYISLSVITQCETLKYFDSILIRPSAKALFTPSSTVGCSPFTVTFRNNSLGANNQGTGMVYHWSFGDGSYDTTTNLNSVSHIYHNGSQKIDTLIVKLYATNECGTDSIQYNIVVFPNTVKPALIINGNERFACAPHTVHFFNNSTGATRFNWNFGDGTVYSSTKSSDTVIHVFNTSGTFIVTLNATNGCSDTTISDSVVVYPSINFPDFSIIKPISCLVDSVQFKNNTDTSKMNNFVWNLGDGTTSNSFELTHQYKQAGVFNVSLFASKTFTTGVTCSATIAKSVQILNNPTAIFTSNDNVLNCSPFNYIVNTTPSMAGSAEWLFSDPYSVDTVAIGFNASHLFTKAGSYRVRLKISNQSGCSDSTIQIVIVTESPIANFDYTDSIICTKNSNSKTITFKNTSTYFGQNIIKYEWWIDGVLASNSSTIFTHTFSASSTDILPKIFNVTLKAISSIGCSTSKTVPISFVPYPKASIVVSKVASCGNTVITASDNEIKVAHLRKWTWTSNNPNAPLIVISNDSSSNITLSIPINTSRSIIDYKLILNVVSGGACADSVAQQIRIYPQPLVDFIIKDTICSNVDYRVTNLSDPYVGGSSSNMGFA
jgi:PKD repeat protein